MNIVDLSDAHKELFALCLEDWSADAREAGSRRACWIERFQSRGLRAKLAVDDHGQIGGMIQYLPIEESFVSGSGLYFILCIWVHGHKHGRGNFQRRGMGKALLEAAEADARSRGAKGMAAWGIWLPFWMRASWFRKHGYRRADRQGLAALMWKPFTNDAQPPRWIKTKWKPADREPGKVIVTVFSNGWCMACNLTTERAKRAAVELGDRVIFREIDTSERTSAAEYGITDDLFIDAKRVGNGPPPSYEKIHSTIAKRLTKLAKSSRSVR
jgi:GNAT superfamily N-acetyltransferase